VCRDVIRCKRWRAERNFWISLLGLVLWMVVHRFRALMAETDIAYSGATGPDRDTPRPTPTSASAALAAENERLKVSTAQHSTAQHQTAG
jgi:hypothetical protein